MKPATPLLALVAAFAFSASAQAANPKDEAERVAKQGLTVRPAAKPKIALRSPGIPVAGLSVEELRTRAAKLPSLKSAARPDVRPKDIQVFSGDTTGGPTWNRPFADGTCCSGLGPVTYEVVEFSVSANDTCDINSVQPGWDGYLFIYENGFDPLDQTTNFVAGDDDGGGGIGTSDINALPLSAGVSYFMVTTGFELGEEGAYDNTIDCPVANVSFAAAGVELTNPGSNDPVLVAQELIIPPSRTITNNGRLNINTEIDYSFSPGEVRYARFHCPGMEFEPGAVVTYGGDPSNVIGAVNGSGTDAIYFSITAGATPVVATDTLSIDGDRTLTSETPIDCTYGLYDFPSQAQAGGETGRVATTSGAYVRFGPSVALVVESSSVAVADVESPDPAYSTFVPSATTFFDISAQIGQFSVGNISAVNGTPQPITLDGDPIDTTDLWSLDTTLVVEGDFGAASEVYFSFDSDCSTFVEPFDDFDDTLAYYTWWNFTATDVFVCYLISGNPIRASLFNISMYTDSADPSTYEVDFLGPLPLGEIVRNGTELQAPLAQLPANWLSRMVLTNRGTEDRPYTIEVLGESGNVISTDNLTGTVAAESTLVVDLNTVLTGFTTDPRATLNVTVDAPNSQIQGLYQIVNPDSGSISNHVMVRPGTN